MLAAVSIKLVGTVLAAVSIKLVGTVLAAVSIKLVGTVSSCQYTVSRFCQQLSV